GERLAARAVPQPVGPAANAARRTGSVPLEADQAVVDGDPQFCLPGRFIEVNLDALDDAQYLPRVAVDEDEGVALVGDEQAAGSPLIQRLSQRPPDLRLPGGVAEEGAEVEDVGTHGAEQFITALLDPGTPAAELVRVVAIADVARIASPMSRVRTGWRR